MQNLIQNPTFDLYARTYCKKSNACDASELTGLNGRDPSIAIAPWTITSAFKDLELDTVGKWSGYGNSDWSMDLNVNDNSYAIGQTVSTVPGASYSISYFIKENPCGPSTKTGFIRATGARESSFSVSGTSWRENSYQFVANSNTVMVEIGSTTRGTG